MILRDALEADADACASIYAPHVLHGVATFEETPPDAEEFVRRWRKICAEGRPWIVAESEGRLAGYAYASAWNDRSAYRFTVQDSVYVDAALHRRGIGRALLLALIDRCAANGMQRMLAAIGGGSAPSVALHAATGFTTIGRAEKIGFKFGDWRDVVYMQRAL
ncbi:MAG: GNAT family N-acetyltransferase [Parvularculaceae bacterium]|nr:GNAT family N-acetyltransferase [Parvularculaceae bacterium]